MMLKTLFSFVLLALCNDWADFFFCLCVHFVWFVSKNTKQVANPMKPDANKRQTSEKKKRNCAILEHLRNRKRKEKPPFSIIQYKRTPFFLHKIFICFSFPACVSIKNSTLITDLVVFTPSLLFAFRTLSVLDLLDFRCL